MTRSEALENDRIDIQKFFGKEDLSGLTIESRKGRKRAYQSIEELFEKEFEGVKSYEPYPDHLENALGSENASFNPFEDTEYKMKLKSSIGAIKEEEHLISESAGSMYSSDQIPQLRQINDALNTISAFTSRITHQQKKKSKSKLVVNLQVKKSLKKSESAKRQFNQNLNRLLRTLSITSTSSTFAVSSDNRIQIENLEESRSIRIKIGSDSDLFSGLNSADSFTPINFETCSKKLEILMKEPLNLISRQYRQEYQNSCGVEYSEVYARKNILVYFDPGILINIILTTSSSYSLWDEPVDFIRFDTYCRNNLIDIQLPLTAEIKRLVENLTNRPNTTIKLHTLMDELSSNVQFLLSNHNRSKIETDRSQEASTPHASVAKLSKSRPNSHVNRNYRSFRFNSHQDNKDFDY